mmetsp:Transcript_42300/g.75770  ORF Transcript_42300/g.75770 Transcript_42300/m.75770 type:complete len:212 (+) Transcript_42300:81-716(+)
MSISKVQLVQLLRPIAHSLTPEVFSRLLTALNSLDFCCCSFHFSIILKRGLLCLPDRARHLHFFFLGGLAAALLGLWRGSCFARLLIFSLPGPCRSWVLPELQSELPGLIFCVLQLAPYSPIKAVAFQSLPEPPKLSLLVLSAQRELQVCPGPRLTDVVRLAAVTVAKGRCWSAEAQRRRLSSGPRWRIVAKRRQLSSNAHLRFEQVPCAD